MTSQRRTTGRAWQLEWIPDIERLRPIWNASGIYFLLCNPTRVGYIGSASRFFKRIKSHFGYLAIGEHRNSKLQSAYNLYGHDAFTWGIVEQCPLDQLAAREQYWINRYPPERLFNISLEVKRNFPILCCDTKLAIQYAQQSGFKLPTPWQQGKVKWYLLTPMINHNRDDYQYWYSIQLNNAPAILAGKIQPAKSFCGELKAS